MNFKSIKIYSYFYLDAISMLGDSIFLYFAIFSLMNSPHGIFSSAFIFALDSVLQIVMCPLTARLIDNIHGLKQKLKISLKINIFLPLLALLPGLFSPITKFNFFFFLTIFILLRVLSNIDSQLRIELPLILNKNGLTSLTKTTAITNIGRRAVLAVGPAIALYLGAGNWFQAALINASSFLCSLLATLIAMSFAFNNIYFSKATNASHPNIKIFALAKWNYAFLFLSNLSIGAGSFLLAKLAILNANIMPFKFLSSLTIFYLAVTIVFVVFTILPAHLDHSVKSEIKELCFTYGIVGFCFSLSAFFMPSGQLFIFFLAGISYAVSLIIYSHAVLKKFHGSPFFVKYVSQAQALGKIGSILSVYLAGVGIKSGLSINALLLTQGLLGIATTVLMVMLKNYYFLSNTNEDGPTKKIITDTSTPV